MAVSVTPFRNDADCIRTRLRQRLTRLVRQQCDGKAKPDCVHGADAFDFINDDGINVILSQQSDAWAARDVLDDDHLRPRVLNAMRDMDPQLDAPGRLEQIVALYAACLEVNQAFGFEHDVYGNGRP